MRTNLRMTLVSQIRAPKKCNKKFSNQDIKILIDKLKLVNNYLQSYRL